MSLFWGKTERRAVDLSAFLTGTDMLSAPGQAAGKASVARALCLPAAYSASRIIADEIACLPLQHYTKGADGQRVDVPLPALFRKPAAEGTLFDWVFQAVSSLTLTGNTTGVIAGSDARGYPSQIEWLHPEDVEVVKVAGRWEWFYLGTRIDRRDVVHIAGYTLPGSPVGLSPIKAFQMSLDTGLYAAEFGRDWFRNGSTPSAVIESDGEITEVTATRLKERFKQAARGRDIVAMGIGARYRPISVPANESQFLESMRMSATQVANIYGLRPERIGGDSGSSMTYANVEQNSINDASALRPWIARLEACFNGFAQGPQYLKFNLDATIRADLKTRYEAHEIGVRSGFVLVNEVRALEDRPPIPGGDEPRAPSGPSEARELAEMVQAVNAGVGKVVSADEGRDLLNRAGAGLSGPCPSAAPAARRVERDANGFITAIVEEP